MKDGRVCGRELKALSLNPNTQPKVFSLPDTAEINPPRKKKTERADYLAADKAHRGSALGRFEETRGEGGAVGGVSIASSEREAGGTRWEACRFGFSQNLASSVPRIQAGGGRDRTGVWVGLWAGGSGGIRFGGDSRGEILLTFRPPSLALPICQAQRAASLSRSPSERDDKSAESGPVSPSATTGRYSSAGNKRQILSPKHSRGYNEARTKQTGESRPDKQFHFQSSA